MADPLSSSRGGAAAGRRLFDALDEGVVVMGTDGTVRDWNAAALRMLALGEDQLLGRAPVDSGWQLRRDGQPPFDEGDPLRSLLACVLGHASVTVGIRTQDGLTRWIAIAAHRVLGGEESPSATIVATITDVSAQRETERQNAHYREIIGALDASYRILEESPIAMCSVDDAGTVLRSNMAFLALGGADATSIVAMVAEEDRATLLHAFARLLDGRTPSVRVETRMHKPSGCEVWCEITAVGMRQGSPDAAILLLINDVTERRRREVRLRQLAEMDPLTGLHNRRTFLHALRERLAALDRPTRRAGGDWSLLLIDLDGFKEVNDTFGHATGDAVLIAISAAIRDRTRLDDTVGRLGGDEFAVLFRSGIEDAVAIGEEIITRIAEAASAVGGAPPVSASVGIVRLRPGRRAEELLEAADDAMYQAKRTGKARVVEAAL